MTEPKTASTGEMTLETPVKSFRPSMAEFNVAREPIVARRQWHEGCGEETWPQEKSDMTRLERPFIFGMLNSIRAVSVKGRVALYPLSNTGDIDLPSNVAAGIMHSH